MADDAIRTLVEGLVSERAARDARLRGLADQLLGRVDAPEAAPAPAAPPSPPVPAEAADPVAPFREALVALRAERDALLQKNHELYDEVQRLQAAGPAPGPVLDPSTQALVEAIRASRHRDFLEFLVREMSRPG